jgi:sec-independent protein translocase protein TatA
MMGLGTPELIIIFVIALVVFGPRKLPELGRSLGRSLSEFNRASNELKHTLDDEIRLEEHRAQSQSTPAVVPPPPASVASAEPAEAEAGENHLGGDTVARGPAHS